MEWFNLIHKTLTSENIDPSTNKNVPKQFYAKNYFIFETQIYQLIEEKIKNEKIFILADGVQKMAEIEDQNSNVTTKIINILEKNLKYII